MKLRTVLVDDEPIARELLALLLAPHPDVELIASCRNGREAIEYLRAHPVDLLFLDIEMPQVDGFNVVEAIGLQHLPPTVFVTAYAQYALRAFDVHAVDYLTKPVEPERLALTLNRVREKIAAHNALLTQEQVNALLRSCAQTYAKRLLVQDGSREILLPVQQIDWIEAADYYCCLHAGGHGYMLRESISALSRSLDERHFLRIHRSAIVNLDRIRAVHREGANESSIELTDGRVLAMSRAGRRKLIDAGRVTGPLDTLANISGRG